MALYALFREEIGRTMPNSVTARSLVHSQISPSETPAHIGEQGLQLIEYYEGLRLSAYRDTGGVPTIGYGHTGDVQMGDTCTFEQAVAYLAADVSWAESFVHNHITTSLYQHQFDAIISFVFNVGVGNFLKSSVYADIQNANLVHVPYSLSLWNKSGGRVVEGLVNRRHSEGVLFATNTLNLAPVNRPDRNQA